MTMTSEDTQVMSVQPLQITDQTPPASTIPEIDEIGDKPAIDATGNDALTAKYDEYTAAIPILVEHHDYQRDRFDEIHAHHVNIFSRIETLDSIAEIAKAIAPEFNIFEEFSFIELEGKAANVVDTVATVSVYAGVGTATFGAISSVYLAVQASKAVKGAQLIPPNSPAVISKLKWAHRMKVLTALGATVSLIGVGFGVAAAIENKKRQDRFLRDAVEGYQIWYRETLASHNNLRSAADDMESDISELMALLGFSTVEELENFLGMSVQVAGEIQGALKTATRMLCASPPLSNAQVASFTGLPPATVARRANLILQDPGLCSIGA